MLNNVKTGTHRHWNWQFIAKNYVVCSYWLPSARMSEWHKFQKRKISSRQDGIEARLNLCACCLVIFFCNLIMGQISVFCLFWLIFLFINRCLWMLVKCYLLSISHLFVIMVDLIIKHWHVTDVHSKFILLQCFDPGDGCTHIIQLIFNKYTSLDRINIRQSMQHLFVNPTLFVKSHVANYVLWKTSRFWIIKHITCYLGKLLTYKCSHGLLVIRDLTSLPASFGN